MKQGENNKEESLRSKRLLILYIIFILISFFGSFFVITEARGAEINLNKIIQIESSRNPIAYNQRANARGLCQITPICLLEYNNFHQKKYKESELFNPAINKKIGRWYLIKRIPQMLKYYKIKSIKTHPLLLKIACYNWGIGNVVKWYRNGAEYKELPQETRKYYAKYFK